MIDVDSFKDFLGVSKAELARRLGLDSKSNTLSLYANGKSTPTYDMCCKLLEMGMTIEELFGSEIANKVVISRKTSNLSDEKASYNAKLDLKDPDVKAAMEEAFKDMLAKAAQSISNK